MLATAISAGFVMGFVGSMPPTGPIAVLVLERGLATRYQEALGIAVGAALAEGLYVSFALFGTAALIERYPSLEIWALRLGILVLLSVGVYFVRFKIRPGTPNGRCTLGAWAKQLGLGFSLVIANPVIVLTWSASAAALYSLSHVRLEASDKLAFVAAACLGIVGWFAALLSALRRFAGNVTLQMTQGLIRSMGALLLVTAAASLPRAW